MSVAFLFAGDIRTFYGFIDKLIMLYMISKWVLNLYFLEYAELSNVGHVNN